MNRNANTRTIRTGLYSAAAKEVCSSVLGQLSDGWGENSRHYENYWRFADVDRAPDGEVIILVDSASGTGYKGYKSGVWGYHSVGNGFHSMDDAAVKAWFARMIKKTISLEYGDNCGNKNYWKRDNVNAFTCYLNYNMRISIAEVYAIYETLLGRKVTSRYSQAVIDSAVGRVRSVEDTAKEAELQARRQQASDKYDKAIVEINRHEQEEIAAIREKYSTARDEAHQQYLDDISKCGGDEN